MISPSVSLLLDKRMFEEGVMMNNKVIATQTPAGAKRSPAPAVDYRPESPLTDSVQSLLSALSRLPYNIEPEPMVFNREIGTIILWMREYGIDEKKWNDKGMKAINEILNSTWVHQDVKEVLGTLVMEILDQRNVAGT